MGMRISSWPNIFRAFLFVFPLLLAVAVFPSAGRISRSSGIVSEDEDCILSSSFPSNFMFGTASSAYQYEGAPLDDGKGLNSWDFFTHTSPESITDRSSADIADDQYHRYTEDIKLMASLGIKSYRFSISWTRILPDGRGAVNQKGIDHYNRVIDALLDHGIMPIVTLFHFDLPQALEVAYRGWLSPQIIEDFKVFAEICFQEFGDRVKYWITINEPNLFVPMGYTMGFYPPGRCTVDGGTCIGGKGNQSEVYVAGHHVLLAHASVVDLFNTKFKEKNGGMLGIVINGPWYKPLNETNEEDVQAAKRIFAFSVRWFLDPIVYGTYPTAMKQRVELSMPSFSREQSKRLKKSFDFIGINYYTTFYASNTPIPQQENQQYVYRDAHVYTTSHRNGVPIGDESGVDGNHVVPSGIGEILAYLTEIYNRPPIIISENGYGERRNSTTNVVEDYLRIKFHKDHLKYLRNAIRNGSDVRGYILWSLLDNFEWTFGYTVRFGLFHVNMSTQERIPKISASWFNNFLKNRCTYYPNTFGSSTI